MQRTLAAAELDWKYAVYVLLGLATCIWAGVLLAQCLSTPKTRGGVQRPRTPDLEKRSPVKAAAREPGSEYLPAYQH
jgi:hypothetical protein